MSIPISLDKCSLCTTSFTQTNPATYHYQDNSLETVTIDDSFIFSPLKKTLQLLKRFDYVTGTMYFHNLPTLDDIQAWEHFLLRFSPVYKNILIVVEEDFQHVIHLHYICETNQRTDNFVRWIKQKLNIPTVKITAQKVKNLHAIMTYLWKNPLLVYSNSHFMIKAFYTTKTQKIVTAESMIANTNSIKDLTHTLTHLILPNQIFNYKQCQKKLPSLILKFLHIPNLEKIIENTINYTLNQKSCQNIQEILINTETCKPKNPNLIKEILTHQNINYKDFISTLFKILTKTNGKKNTLVFIGPPSTGKTTIARSILSMYPSFGEIINCSNFMFQDLINHQIAIWEEPIINQECAQKVKLIMEGAKTSVDVKFKAPTQISNIPLIITTNHDLWHWVPEEKTAIEERCEFFEFNNKTKFTGDSPCPLDTKYNDYDDEERTDTPCKRRRLDFINLLDDDETDCEVETNFPVREQSISKTKEIQEPLPTDNFLIPHKCEWLIALDKNDELDNMETL